MAKTLTKKLFSSYKNKCRGIDFEGDPVLLEKDAETYFLNIFSDGTTEVFCRYRQESVSCNVSKKADPRDNGICPYMIRK